jgi:hypothetical protein
VVAVPKSTSNPVNVDTTTEPQQPTSLESASSSSSKPDDASVVTACQPTSTTIDEPQADPITNGPASTGLAATKKTIKTLTAIARSRTATTKSRIPTLINRDKHDNTTSFMRARRLMRAAAAAADKRPGSRITAQIDANLHRVVTSKTVAGAGGIVKRRIGLKEGTRPSMLRQPVATLRLATPTSATKQAVKSTLLATPKTSTNHSDTRTPKSLTTRRICTSATKPSSASATRSASGLRRTASIHSMGSKSASKTNTLPLFNSTTIRSAVSSGVFIGASRAQQGDVLLERTVVEFSVGSKDGSDIFTSKSFGLGPATSTKAAKPEVEGTTTTTTNATKHVQSNVSGKSVHASQEKPVLTEQCPNVMPDTEPSESDQKPKDTIVSPKRKADDTLRKTTSSTRPTTKVTRLTRSTATPSRIPAPRGRGGKIPGKWASEGMCLCYSFKHSLTLMKQC